MNLKQYISKQWCLPYRIWSFLEKKMPVICYYKQKITEPAINTKNYWESTLDETWNDKNREWPTKNEKIIKYCHNGDFVLDCGCGTGSIMKYLAHNGNFKIFGLDFSYKAIQSLKKYPAFFLINGSIPKLPFKDASFNCIILSEVLEHIIFQKKLLKEAKRLLCQDGRIIVTIPDNCMGPLTLKEHVRKYNRDSISKLLSNYFKVQDTISFIDKNHNLPTILAVGKKH